MFKSNRRAVNYALNAAKHEFCVGVGTLYVGEVKNVTPVLSGDLRKSIDSEVMDNNVGVTVGSSDKIKEIPYAIDVEKGIGQPAQSYLEAGVMNAIPKITSVAEAIYRRKMGGL